MTRAGAIVVLFFVAMGMNWGCVDGTSGQTGACCLFDGSCLDLDSNGCVTTNGVFSDGQSCSDLPCAPPSGACCLTDGSCVESASDVCADSNGTFNEAQSCVDVDCPKPGACCLADGSCVESDSDACAATNGLFNEAQSCADVDCPQTGACCLADSSCFSSDTEECSSVNGTLFPGQTCAAVSCPRAGACCLVDDGSCFDSDSQTCSLVNATFREGQTCDMVACPQPGPANGACCLPDGSCQDSDSDACESLSGDFSESQTCAQVDCPPADLDDLRLLATELESVMRDDLDWYIQTVSIVGREYWNLNDDDSSFTEELLGKDGASPGANSPLVTRSFVARYNAVHRANLLIEATANSDAGLTTEEKNGLTGYAKTFQAYALLLAANHQFSNGIFPVEALGDANPEGQVLSYTASLQYIADLLDEAATLLTNGGAAFVFNLSIGFVGFSTPATFRQFNRALSARVRLYQGDKAGAISGIAGSFFNINGSMSTGPAHTFGVDAENGMYYEPDQDLFTVHPDFLADADAGDLRVSQKTRAYVPSAELTVPVTADGLSGNTQVNTIASDIAPFPIIRNEELILIYAEAQIGSDVNESLAAINRVRNASGLGNYLGATDDASMLNEVIKQRRYSLFGEGHRWIDLRRTGKFGQINVDRPGDVVHMEFPRPDSSILPGA